MTVGEAARLRFRALRGVKKTFPNSLRLKDFRCRPKIKRNIFGFSANTLLLLPRTS
jgi:hypothetical protein